LVDDVSESSRGTPNLLGVQLKEVIWVAMGLILGWLGFLCWRHPAWLRVSTGIF